MSISSVKSGARASTPPSDDYITHRSDELDSSWRPSNNFREYLPPPGHSRTVDLDDADVYAYSREILSRSKPRQMFGPWYELLKEPFVGITSDGVVKEGLYSLADEGSPTKQMVVAARMAIEALSVAEREKVICHDIDSDEWRKWCNPEIVFYDVGIRLEVLHQRKIDLILKLLEASLSQRGYEKALGAMRINQFLGEIVQAKAILNQNSYHFRIFGEPSEEEPWGFSLFGHHLCLSVFVLRKQISISPMFIGAEPNEIDCGPYKGLKLFNSESAIALELMQSLRPDLQKKAQLYEKLHDSAMPDGRWHPADQRHLSGAFQDNRVIPYEGIQATDLTAAQTALLLSLASSFLEILPDATLMARMGQIKTFLGETYFCWIGGFGDENPFYYRIQSPVICLEFDHHAGVFLLNAEPAKCHIHTIVRTPNGNDYGKQWLKVFHEERGRP